MSEPRHRAKRTIGIVDPGRRSIECYRLRKVGYEQVLTGKGNTRIEHPDFPGLTIDLGTLWR